MDLKKVLPLSFMSLIIVFSLIYAATQPRLESNIVTASENEKELSFIQVNACNSADYAGTCNSKLNTLKIVSSSDCCLYLGKCC